MVKKRKISKKSRLNAKLRVYRRVLMDDEDWDYAYILRHLKFKLARTRKCIVSNEIITSNKIVGRQIKQVEDLLEKVIDDRYIQQLFRNFHKKYGRIKMESGKAEPGSRAVPVRFYYSKETARNRKQIRREASRLYRKVDKMRIHDLNRAFDLMKKNIWRWWD